MMLTSDFKCVLEAAIKKWQLIPEETYMLFSWNSIEYHPFIYIDLDIEDDNYMSSVFVCSEDKVKTFTSDIGPNPFYTVNDVEDPANAVRFTLTLKDFLKALEHQKYAKICIATKNLPKNIMGDINPYKTKYIENRKKYKMLVLFWDYRSLSEKIGKDLSKFGTESLSYEQIYSKNHAIDNEQKQPLSIS